MWIEEKANISGLLGEGVPVKLVPPLFYAAFLALIYIWSNHSAENTIREIEKVQQEVEDIRAEMARLKNEGFVLLNEEPKKGADNKIVAFLHPKASNGVLVELVQNI